jgi:hypothetical protein
MCMHVHVRDKSIRNDQKIRAVMCKTTAKAVTLIQRVTRFLPRIDAMLTQ